MPATPWKKVGEVDPVRDYLALLSYLPLKHRWRIPSVVLHTRRIVAQLQQTSGLVGFAMMARPLRRQFWTLSVWDNDGALQAFVDAGSHAVTMRAMTPHVGATRFIRWKVRGVDLPPSWDDAFDRWSAGGG